MFQNEYDAEFFQAAVDDVRSRTVPMASSAQLQKIGQGLVADVDTELDAAARNELGRQEVVSEADDVLSRDVLDTESSDELQMLAAEFQKPAPGEVVKTAALANELAKADGFLTVRIKQLAADRREVIAAGRELLATAQDEVGLGLNTRTAASVAQAIVDPSDAFRYTALLDEVLPEAGIGNGITPGMAVGKFTEALLTLPKEEAIGRLKALVERSQTLGLAVDSTLDQSDLLRMVFESMSDDSVYGKQVSAEDVLGVVNTALPFAAPLVKGAKAVTNLVRVGHIKGSAAALAARTRRGQSTLLDAAKSPAGDQALASAGTSAGRVVGAAALPKAPGRTILESDDVVPFESVLFTESERKFAQDTVVGLKGGASHLNKSEITEEFDGGFKYKQTYGRDDGGAFKTKSEVNAAMFDLGAEPDSFKIVGDASKGYYAEWSGVRYYDMNDKGKFGEMATGGYWKLFAFGKGQALDAETRALTNWAATQSATLEGKMNELTRDYFILAPGTRAKVNELLVRYTDKKWLTPDELAREGVDEAGQRAYAKLRQASDTAYRIENARVYRAAKEGGYKGLNIRGNQYIGRPVDSIPDDVAEVFMVGDNIAIDAASAKARNGTFMRLPSATRLEGDAEYRYVFVPATGKGSKAVTGLPRDVLNYRPSYYGVRRYTAPVFITTKMTKIVDGVEVTTDVVVRTARSQKSAERWIAAQAEATGKVFEARPDRGALGVAGDDVALADVEYLGRRRDDYIPDIDLELGGAKGLDAVRIGNVESAIRGMQHTASLNYGISKANELLIAQWNRTYGSKLGMEFNAVGDFPLKGSAEPKLAAEAMALHRYIKRNMGLDAESLSADIGQFRLNLANFFWNRHLAPLDWLGDQVAGRSTSAISMAKTATYVTYLALNPIRQAVMQATMLPTYLGVNGAGRYLLDGQFFSDFATLAGAHLRSGDAARLAQFANGDAKASKASVQALEDWNRSGLSRLVDANILTIDTIADTSKAVTSRGGMVAQEVVNRVKEMGIDLGIQMDKRAAFLIARNRYLTEAKLPRTHRLTDDELVKVASFAEDLSLNQNRSDVLATQRGAVSLITQFMSHQIKMTGRVFDQVQAFLPKQLDLGGEANFTRAERRRMAAVAFLTYGTAGYGVTELVKTMEREAGVELPVEVRDTIEQGIAGQLVDNLFRLADWDGDPTDLAFSSSMAPTSFVGTSAQGMAGLLKSVMLLDADGLWDGATLMFNSMKPASFSLIDGVREMVALGMAFAGNPRLAAGDPVQQIQAVAAKGLTQFPILGAWEQGMAIMENGTVIDSLGREVTRASFGEGLARFTLGLRDRGSEEIRRISDELYEQTLALDEPGRLKVMRDAATTDWKTYIEPFIDSNMSYTEMLDSVEALMVSRKEVYGTYFWSYQKAIQEKMLDLSTNQSKDDKLVNMVSRMAARGQLPIGENYITRLEQGAEFEGRSKLVEILKGLNRTIDPGQFD